MPMNTKTQPPNYYETHDLPLAATLALSFPIEAIERGPSGRASFTFERARSLDALVEAYWRRELKVEPQAYSSQLRLLKARIYGEG